MAIAPDKKKVSVQMINWLLYQLPTLKAEIDGLEPCTVKPLVALGAQARGRGGSEVERCAIKKATLSAVISAVERALKTLHPEQRKVYRMRYRARMTYRQISRRLYISEETVGRRLAEVREIVGQYVEQVSMEELKEFRRFFRSQS